MKIFFPEKHQSSRPECGRCRGPLRSTARRNAVDSSRSWVPLVESPREVWAWLLRGFLEGYLQIE